MRRQKIIQNLELLRAELGTRLDAKARDRVSLMVTDLVFPAGVVGLDEHTRSGSLIIQHYLTGTASEHAPLMWLHAIRLAKLGYHVDAVEMSTVACEKIERFACAEAVRVRVRNEPVETVDLTGTDYDLVQASRTATSS